MTDIYFYLYKLFAYLIMIILCYIKSNKTNQTKGLFFKYNFS